MPSFFDQFKDRFTRSRADQPPIEAPPSPLEEGRRYLTALKIYAKARLSLFQAETAELAARLKPIVALAVVALVVTWMMLLLLEVGILGAMIAYWDDWHWFVNALILAGAHLVLLLILGIAIHHRVSRLEPFKYSKDLGEAESRQAPLESGANAAVVSSTPTDPSTR